MTAGLPQETAAWIESEVGGRLVAARRMTGGLTSSVHRCTVILPSGARTFVVLRRCTGVDPALRMRALEDELSALRQLEATAVPAPVPLAISDGRETDGTAALLMSRVPGHVDLAPEDPTRWVHQAAMALTDIQALPFQFPEYEPRPRTSPAEVPVWAEQPALWRVALEALQSPAADWSPCFAHADFQHFNLLWSRQRLTGVVDWAHPRVSSPDLDVAHCRLNLGILYGQEMAERFRLAYEAEAGRRCDPWWDLHRLTRYSPDWQRFIPMQVAGRIPVDVAGMTRRVEEAMAGALRRL